MKISQKGIDLIKSFEGKHLTAYQDPIGIWTIGYGHTSGVYEGQTITEQTAENLLRQDIEVAENAVKLHVIENVMLNQNQFDALVSLVFNVGSHNIFTKSYSNGYTQGSSLYNLLLQRKYKEAGERFSDFVKAGGIVLNGLVRRRKEEHELYKKKLPLRFCPYCACSLESYT